MNSKPFMQSKKVQERVHQGRRQWTRNRPIVNNEKVLGYKTPQKRWDVAGRDTWTYKGHVWTLLDSRIEESLHWQDSFLYHGVLKTVEVYTETTSEGLTGWSLPTTLPEGSFTSRFRVDVSGPGYSCETN